MQKIYPTGEKWKNELTQPVEFNIGKHSKKNIIRSLSKPASPRFSDSASTVHKMLQKYNLLLHEHPLSNNEEDEDAENVFINNGDMENYDDFNKSIDTDGIPPQGLFSSPLTSNILQAVTANTYTENAAAETKQTSPNTSEVNTSPKTHVKSSIRDSVLNSTPSPEWLRRKQEKTMELQKVQEVCSIFDTKKNSHKPTRRYKNRGRTWCEKIGNLNK